MLYIMKTGTPTEATGKKLTKEFIDSCWNPELHMYENLHYDRSRLKSLGQLLINEQNGTDGYSHCCYCMRRLNIDQSNVTYEHIIPHKISKSDWNLYKGKYLNFPNLKDKCILICFGGELSSSQSTSKIKGLPYPHFVSYHNLVASCDGTIFENNKMSNSRCCNNNRQDKFVMPIYLSESLSGEISYTSKGELDYDDGQFDYIWFDNQHLNLTNSWLTLVRRMWYRISQSDYNDKDVEKAEHDRSLRQEIIDDVDANNEILSWQENDTAWRLFVEYSWFYVYYKGKI